MHLPCGCNNFHIHSKAERLPRDRGISEEIELKDTSGYVISSAPPYPILPAARFYPFPITSLFLKAPRHPVDVLGEECAHREAAVKAAVHKEYFGRLSNGKNKDPFFHCASLLVNVIEILRRNKNLSFISSKYI